MDSENSPCRPIEGSSEHPPKHTITDVMPVAAFRPPSLTRPSFVLHVVDTDGSAIVLLGRPCGRAHLSTVRQRPHSNQLVVVVLPDLLRQSVDK